MPEHQPTPRAAHLLQKYLSGDISKGEEAELDRLALKDAVLKEAMEGLREVPEAEHDEAVRRVRARLRTVGGRRLRPGAIAAAAVAAGLVLAAALWLQKGDDSARELAMEAAKPATEGTLPPAAAPLPAPAPQTARPEGAPSPLAAPPPVARPEPDKEKTAPPPQPPVLAQLEEDANGTEADEPATFSTEMAMEDAAADAPAVPLQSPPPPKAKMERAAPSAFGGPARIQASADTLLLLKAWHQAYPRLPRAGRVVLAFEVDESGRPARISILEGASPEADSLAQRILLNGPLWSPVGASGKMIFSPPQ